MTDFDNSTQTLSGDISSTGEISNSAILPLTSKEREAIKQRSDQAKRQLEQLNRERKQVQSAVAATARRLWAEAGPADPNHMYLAAHGLSADNLHQLRGKLIAPMYFDGELVNLLSVRPDGVTRVLSGGRFNGCYLLFGKIDESRPIYLCSDFVTAARLYEQTGGAVACSITASNLLAAGRSIQVVHPTAQIIIFNKVGENESARDYAKHAARELGAEVWGVGNE